METNSTLRFTDRVQNYVRYRPNYPRALLECLVSRANLKPGQQVADVGSGTGISTEMFLAYGNQVFAVEPNSAMRAAAEEVHAGDSNFHSINGTSEATELGNGSVDLIVAAQAFHWFKPDSTRREFDRILKPGGRIALIWNDRRTDDTAFSRDYESLLVKYSTDYREVNHKNVDEGRIRAFLGNYEKYEFNNHQDLDFEGLLGRVTSSSYAPNVGHAQFPAMREELLTLFNREEKAGVVRINYTTQLFLSARRPDCIRHYSEIQEGPQSSYYRGTTEFLSIGSPFSKAFGIKSIGIHHELLPPGRRTSWPHAEGSEDEFVFVLEGHPDVWLNGELYRLNPGDGVGFPSGTGIAHSILNNTAKDVRLLVVGEASKKENKIYYPLHPTLRKQRGESWWANVPKHELGLHDGLPDQLRTAEPKGPLNFTGTIPLGDVGDLELREQLESYGLGLDRFCLDEEIIETLRPKLERALPASSYPLVFKSDVGGRTILISRDGRA